DAPPPWPHSHLRSPCRLLSSVRYANLLRRRLRWSAAASGRSPSSSVFVPDSAAAACRASTSLATTSGSSSHGTASMICRPSAAGGPLADQVRKVAQAKTLGYAAFGARGVAAAFIKGVLCNWMVTLGAVLAFASRSTIGKIVAMWLPIATFFAHGYEHSIVNMFVVPAGMLLGTPVSVAGWWFWNQIPVTLGNIVAGVLLTGFTLSVSYPKPAESHVRAA
ncbi:MAG: hypothetical protein DMG03_07185, partial [Acidobacteria bacterium]